MISKAEKSVGYLFSVEQKGGPGSGIRGHRTPKSQINALKRSMPMHSTELKDMNGEGYGLTYASKDKKEMFAVYSHMIKGGGFRNPSTTHQAGKKVLRITAKHPQGHLLEYLPNQKDGSAKVTVFYSDSNSR